MSAKWKNIKVVFRYAETFDGPIIKPQFPMAFDLTDDPGEQLNLTSERMDMMWMFCPVLQRLIGLQKSFVEYPNIQPGQEFDGYAAGRTTYAYQHLAAASCHKASSQGILHKPIPVG